MNELKRRLILKYDNLISELESVNNENKAFIETANQDPNNPEIIERMKLAHENWKNLEMAKAARDYYSD